MSKGSKPKEWTEGLDPSQVIGFGVAGNFAGHLEQAGEASDFVAVKVEGSGAPKGVFPFYVPGGDPEAHFLHRYPVSSARLRLASQHENHQIEPEVALLCRLRYREAGGERRVEGIEPMCAMAHNDCSIRREGARKISEKKNWGAQTKGTAQAAIPIDSFAAGGVLDEFRLASFLVRDGELHEYGQDSPLAGAGGYSYFNERLVDWLVGRLSDQGEEGPLEDIGEWLRVAGHPEHALISIGATRYTAFGEKTFLEVGDRIVVALYDARAFEPAEIRELARGARDTRAAGLSLLVQQVVGPQAA